MTRTALITGVAGQDGIYLARLLLADGIRVVGTVRPGSSRATRMAPYLSGVLLEEHDLRDAIGFAQLLRRHEPDEIYNLAGFTSVGRSWAEPETVSETNAGAVVNMLEAVAASRPEARFFQASSGEQHGAGSGSPYAQAKIRAQEATSDARERGLFACSGVLYAHESPVRGEGFVTRKISRSVAAIAAGRQQTVTLGNLDVRRDWGHARDFVGAMPAMLRRDEPEDFTIATGIAYSLRDIVEHAFTVAGIARHEEHVKHDPDLVRPVDADVLMGDVAPARERLGWAASTHALAVMEDMVSTDIERLATGVEEDVSYLDRGATHHPESRTG